MNAPRVGYLSATGFQAALTASIQAIRARCSRRLVSHFSFIRSRAAIIDSFSLSIVIFSLLPLLVPQCRCGAGVKME
jgi:uncharacterized membrane protein